MSSRRLVSLIDFSPPHFVNSCPEIIKVRESDENGDGLHGLLIQGFENDVSLHGLLIQGREHDDSLHGLLSQGRESDDSYTVC